MLIFYLGGRKQSLSSRESEELIENAKILKSTKHNNSPVALLTIICASQLQVSYIE